MIRRVNLDDEIYTVLVGELLDGRYIENKKLSPDQIAQDMGVSKTPVLFALKRMAQEGLLETNRSAGFSVRTLSEEENITLRNAMIFFDRAVLHGCIQKVEQDDVTELRELAKQTLDRDSDTSYFRRDFAFHLRLIQLAENPFITESYRRLFLLLNLTRKSRDEGQVERKVARRPQQHIEICDALEEKNMEKIDQVYLSHYLVTADRADI